MDVEDFIARWTANEGGAERANYAMFLTELCDVLGLPHPAPANATTQNNDYVFERAVRPRESEGTTAPKRIDLYKRGSFILEAKQSRLPGKKNAPPSIAGRGALFGDEDAPRGRRTAVRGWDVLMANARRQAEDYVFRLPPEHPAPPFIVVCDVGHALEIYSDFSGSGRNYTQFPDRQGFRVFMEDLRRPEIRERLAAIWTDPHSLDPTREAARVTQGIAARLAAVSKHLEEDGRPPEEVALFLMRCIFTMFAEDVELLPKGKFTELLGECIGSSSTFAPMMDDLWRKMDGGGFFSGFNAHLKRFNGNLFHQATAFPLNKEEIGELLAAAKMDWRTVEPAIFGTLLEQALDKDDRKRLGAHYTPRAYVERLVNVTILEPLRGDWEVALTRAEDAKARGDEAETVRIVQAFHHQLCATRVLDPACGTGNFLYVSLELMKKLEGEVLETLAELGTSESMGLDRETVDPHQFLGIELNPRAAAIAELVLWIGYLQQHYRTRSGHPAEPILRAFHNIEHKDAVLTWDGWPLPKGEQKNGELVEIYPNARRPEWPRAEFIVGNPPFLGKGAAMRGPLGDGYVEALWRAHPWIDRSSDFVMYWWDQAAENLTRRKTPLRRFGLVTTNSLTGVFNRRTVERHLDATQPISLVYAVPDHPWTKATRDSAAVRIAMTVAEAGTNDGVIDEVISEARLDTDEPQLALSRKKGRIHADITIGPDVSAARKLLANEGLSCNGMMLAGQGFLLSDSEANYLADRDPTARDLIKPFMNGGELVRQPRHRFVIDAFGSTDAELRIEHPLIYQHLLGNVKPERDSNRREAFRKRWWIFGEPRRTFRPALENLVRYIGTTETSKHRIFQFLPSEVVPDHMIIAIAFDDASMLSILSSQHHGVWALAAGGWLGVGNDPRYSKSRCFDPFPFPDPSEDLKAKLCALGEELDGMRKRVQTEYPDLTLTGLYNVLEKLKACAALTPAEENVKSRGLVLILKELHEKIDHSTAEAYGWPADLSDEDILERLVALNAERAKEEAAGHVRWLRPDYQVPRFAKGAAAESAELDLGGGVVAIDKGLPSFPADKTEQPLAVLAALAAADRPMNAAALARGFKRGGKRVEHRVAQVLDTLALYGRVTARPDGTYVARHAA